MANKQTISDLTLERFLSGDLSSERHQAIESLANTDLKLQSRIAALKHSNEQFIEKCPVAEVYMEVTRRLEKEQVQKRRQFSTGPFILPAASLASMLLLAVLVVPLFNDQQNQIKTQQELVGVFDDDIRLKGISAKLNVYKQDPIGLEKLKHEGVAKSHDVLQLSYVAGESQYGAIFSIDGNGSVTLHYPEKASSSTRLKTDGEIRLDHAYQLDDAPGYEQFYFITADKEIDVADVLLKAQKNAGSINAGALNLDSSIHQTIVRINKDQISS